MLIIDIFEQLTLMETLRDEIQEVDKKLLSLLEKRIKIAKQIGDIKRENNKPFYVPEVEKKKIEKLASICEFPGLVETLWPMIMCYTRSVE